MTTHICSPLEIRRHIDGGLTLDESDDLRHRMLKQTLDPNRILAPGRYEFGSARNQRSGD
uniref:Uncharacterized protein n=1 Tax=uncultured sulfate-reducing bacterium TaxID=153939 RepID=Q3IBR5_9BACT|nr:hypothetical protein 42c90030 [uncultured sulfate-reducing bacterium]